MKRLTNGIHSHDINSLYPHMAMDVEIEDLYPDVEVEVIDGFYKATLINKDSGNGFRFKEDVTLPHWSNNHGNHFTIGDSAEFYVAQLNVAQLVAAHKIFFDRWCFVSNTVFDHQLMLACESELKRRRETHSHSLTHSHMPAHTHAINTFSGPQPGTTGHTMCYASPGGHTHSHLPFHSHVEEKPWVISAENKSPY